MDITKLRTSVITSAAISALKNAYDLCSDKSAKESILTAVKAVIQLDQYADNVDNFEIQPENEGNYDPSEYCAAV